MKKCLLFIFVFGITFSLWNTKALAYTEDDFNYIAIVKSYYQNYYQIIGDTYFSTFNMSQASYGYYYDDHIPRIIVGSNFSNAADALNYLINNPTFISGNNASSTYEFVLTIKGTTTGGVLSDSFFPTYQDFLDSLDPPEPETNWWDDLYNEFLRQMGLTEDGMLYPIVELWKYLFPDPEIINQGDIEIVEPPSPTPLPTSIPYSTSIDPDTGDIIYHYNGITSTLPPPEPTYTITYPPDPGIAYPSGIVYPDEGLQDVIDSIDDNIIEYQDGIETIRDSFSILPVKWFAFFGIPAAILIIAGVIKSLLG